MLDIDIATRRIVITPIITYIPWWAMANPSKTLGIIM